MNVVKQKFCQNPWTWMEINPAGECYPCGCSGWLPYSIGNLLENTLEEIWNSERAQRVRQSILNGSFKYCNSEWCHYIVADILPTSYAPFNKAPGLIIDDLPTNYKFSNDESCNLKCPTCRIGKISFTQGPEYEKRKKINDALTSRLFAQPTDRNFSIHVTGAGDAFGSKIYREMLYNIDGTKFPNLEIILMTNGVMFTPKIWDKIEKIHNNLGHCLISIDAATKDTYENKTRLGGHWDRLLSNLDFLNEKQKAFPKMLIDYVYVVQQANYKEIVKFAELILERFDMANEICFVAVNDWGHWSKKEYTYAAVHNPTHPEHKEFLKILADPIFDNPIIDITTLAPYRRK